MCIGCILYKDWLRRRVSRVLVLDCKFLEDICRVILFVTFLLRR